jgi:hypothetical protein
MVVVFGGLWFVGLYNIINLYIYIYTIYIIYILFIVYLQCMCTRMHIIYRIILYYIILYYISYI